MEANASICMCVNGDKIEKSESADHLGHRRTMSLCVSLQLLVSGCILMFMCDFGHTYSFVKSKLF